MARRPDPIFADPRLARIYDDIEGDRSDLDHYAEIVDELDARRVLDVGCGTGSLACRLAPNGIDVVGVDPAEASLDVARSKPGGELVTWVHGDAAALPPGLEPVALTVMTGNVAQVFVTDHDWTTTLDAIARSLVADGRFVFETRIPAQRAWETWDTGDVTSTVATSAGEVETWTSVVDVSESTVAFRHHYRFLDSGDVVTSDSTLRFRSLDEITTSLHESGFSIDEVRDAPDRPGLEYVVIARPSSDTKRESFGQTVSDTA